MHCLYGVQVLFNKLISNMILDLYFVNYQLLMNNNLDLHKK